MQLQGARRACGAWLIAGGLAGCGPLVFPEGDTETEGSGDEGSTTAPPPSTTAPPPPGTATSPPPPSTTVGSTAGDESTSDEPATSSVFLPYPDGGIGDPECDLWEQDCPPGEKCMPWANDGGNVWNSLRCSPIAEDPDAVGEPCLVEGSGVSGIDSCEAGAMCWDVDPETLEGYCVAFCMGDESNPMCEDPAVSCALTSDGVLALCIPSCDPLVQDCPEGEACYGVDAEFYCAPDASGEMGAPGDECEFINVCDPGSFCASAELVPDCPGMSCCSSFCDLDDEVPPCLPGQECTPWYEPGQGPPGYEDIGACALPM